MRSLTSKETERQRVTLRFMAAPLTISSTGSHGAELAFNEFRERLDRALALVRLDFLACVNMRYTTNRQGGNSLLQVRLTMGEGDRVHIPHL